MLNVAAARGFTVIELLIGVTLIGVLLALGAPAMGTYLQNSKIGNVTQSYYSGLQAARTEAIRRNTVAQLVLTNTALSTADVANNLTADANGTNWVVRAASSPGVWHPAVDMKTNVEGEASAGAAVVVAASGPAGFGGVIGFNGFGGTADGNPYSIFVSNPAAGICKANADGSVNSGGSIRCRLINITAGGQIAVCDPAAAIGDSRAC